MQSKLQEILGLFIFDEKYAGTLDKFLSSLPFIDVEEAKKTKAFLESKGIKVVRPSQVNIFLNSYEYVTQIVSSYEQNGDLKALQDDPLRINCKTALERIQYLKQNGYPYLDEKGRYYKDIFHKVAFNNIYNTAQVVEPVQPVVQSEPLVQETAILNDVTEEILAAPVQPEPVVAPVVEQPVLNEEPVNVSSPIDASVFDASTGPANANNEMENVADPITLILSKPQTIALNDETFERYERLSDSIRQISYVAYGEEEINDTIIDNLIKLVTNEIPDDEKVIYYAMTYGKVLNEEQIAYLKSRIDEELNNTSIMNLNLGR